MSILSIENLSYTYPGGQKAVLREVNAEFEAGKMYAITGPSGSGKSTLLSLLAGMETPTEGGIVCEGESLADMDLDAYRREKIAFVFQAYQLLPLLTARENVCLPMEMQGADCQPSATPQKTSKGESQSKHFLGRLLMRSRTAFKSSCERE